MTEEIVNRTGGVEVNGRLLFGMDAELALKQQARYDHGMEAAVCSWIEKVLGEKLEPRDDIAEALKSGIVLVKLINTIQPGSIKSYNKRDIPLMHMENIKLYLEACWKIGVPSADLFVCSDLYQKRGMQQVLQNLASLSRLAESLPSYDGPVMEARKKKKGEKPVKHWELNFQGPKLVTDLPGSNASEQELRSEVVKLKEQVARAAAGKERAEQEVERLSEELGRAKAKAVGEATAKKGGDINAAQTLALLEQLQREVATLKGHLARAKEATQRMKMLEAELRDSKAECAALREQNAKLRRELERARSVASGPGQRDSDAGREKPPLESKAVSSPNLTSATSEASSGGSSDADGAGGVGASAKDYFLLSIDEEVEEVKELERYLIDILDSKPVEFAEVAELNSLFHTDSGRRMFAQLLEKGMKERPSVMLSDDSFELLLFLTNTTLMEMDQSQAPDIITARVLMHASTVIRRESAEEYVQDFIKDHHVWERMAFWEELFWDELAKQHRSRESSDDVLHTVDSNLTVQVLEHVLGKMLVWGVGKPEVKQFAIQTVDQAKVPLDVSSLLLNRMKSDLFWDEIRLRRIHGTLRERAPKDKESRRSRLRARVQEHFSKRRERKEEEARRKAAIKSSGKEKVAAAKAEHGK